VAGGGQFQTQQTKVTFRNICDSTKFGTAKQILDMIDEMISKVNSEARSLPIRIDRKSFDKIIKSEELVLAARAEEEAKQNPVQDTEETSLAQGDDTVEQKDHSVGQNEVPGTKSMEETSKRTTSDALQDDSTDDDVPHVIARALYVVPAKRSRRRGEKPGCAYLVLVAPPPPPPPALPLADIVRELVQTAPTPEAPQDGGKMEADNVVNHVERQKNASSGRVVSSGQSVAPQQQLTAVRQYTQAEKNRFAALAKLGLTRAVEHLSAHALQDAKTSQTYGQCQVFASEYGKTWRDGFLVDRREGTIESTGDYREFFNKQNKADEVRKSRPKPAPGGGALTCADTNSNDGEPLSAIVMHLRAKHREQSQRKKVTNKAKKDVNKSAGTKDNKGRDSKGRDRDSKGRDNKGRDPKSGRGGGGRSGSKGRGGPGGGGNRNRGDAGEKPVNLMKNSTSSG
jgi:uncharacterized membrane protein YgcG